MEEDVIFGIGGAKTWDNRTALRGWRHTRAGLRRKRTAFKVEAKANLLLGSRLLYQCNGHLIKIKVDGGHSGYLWVEKCVNRGKGISS